MKMRRIAVSLTSLLTVSALAFVACVPEKKHKAVALDNLEQNALDAEQAELAMAQAEDPPASKWTKPVENKPSKTVAPTQRKPASADGTYIVQVGAFKVKENAERLHNTLQAAGYKSVLEPSATKSGIYLVHLEPTKDRTMAETWASELKSKSIDSHIFHK